MEMVRIVELMYSENHSLSDNTSQLRKTLHKKLTASLADSGQAAEKTGEEAISLALGVWLLRGVDLFADEVDWPKVKQDAGASTTYAIPDRLQESGASVVEGLIQATGQEIPWDVAQQILITQEGNAYKAIAHITRQDEDEPAGLSRLVYLTFFEQEDTEFALD